MNLKMLEEIFSREVEDWLRHVPRTYQQGLRLLHVAMQNVSLSDGDLGSTGCKLVRAQHIMSADIVGVSGLKG